MTTFTPDEIALSFANHVERMASARFVAEHRFSAEAWFQVELATMLAAKGLRVIPGYPYRDGGNADLGVQTPRGLVCIELKCFVRGQDAKKKEQFPKQIARLENSVRIGEIAQAIAFVTLLGYTENVRIRLLERFFGREGWRHSPASPLVQGLPPPRGGCGASW